VDAIMHYKGADQLLSVKALNEFDPKCVCRQSWPSFSSSALWDICVTFVMPLRVPLAH
jgi:hypothetical protein